MFMLRRAAARSLSASAVRSAMLIPRALSTAPPTRFQSTATIETFDEEEAAWEQAFIEISDEVYTDGTVGMCTHEQSAEGMRRLVKSGLLRHTDLRGALACDGHKCNVPSWPVSRVHSTHVLPGPCRSPGPIFQVAPPSGSPRC